MSGKDHRLGGICLEWFSRERLVRYPALLAKLFYILIETKSDTAFFFQLFFLAREVYILCFEDIP